MLVIPPLLAPSSTAGETPARQGNPATGVASGPLVGTPPAATDSPALVYIIENDPISSVITELIVKKNLFGGEVRCYANGQWAFDELLLTLREGSALPDLLVLDLDMPLMDGWELLDALANVASAQAIRVFVQTSSINPDDRVRALRYQQVAGFFSKPLQEAGIAAMRVLLQQARESSTRVKAGHPS
jgi:CheY-like chemotaxis protein